MSQLKQYFEIAPQELDIPKESKIVYGFKCPTCRGRGHHTDHQNGGIKRKECKRCNGTGKLRAEVEIRWQPDYFDE